jgi:hypothetical protein
MNGSDSIFTWLDGRAYGGGYKDDKKHGWGSSRGPAARSGEGTGTRASSMGTGNSTILKTGPVYLGSGRGANNTRLNWRDMRLKWRGSNNL